MVQWQVSPIGSYSSLLGGSYFYIPTKLLPQNPMQSPSWLLLKSRGKLLLNINWNPHFSRIAFKSHDSFNAATISLRDELGRRISQQSGDHDRKTKFFFQRLGEIMQRSNAVLFGYH